MKTYEKNINGIKHTFQLSDEDAKAQGLTAADAVENKVETAKSPLDFGTPSTDGQETEAKAKADAANKAKAAENKSATPDAK